jgi:hypothetical protein
MLIQQKRRVLDEHAVRVRREVRQTNDLQAALLEDLFISQVL